MTATVSTMEAVQEGWRRRWTDKAVERPSCYDRPSFGGVFKAGCSSWFKPGGNAYMVGTMMIDKGGKGFSWAACNGCKQKGAT